MDANSKIQSTNSTEISCDKEDEDANGGIGSGITTFALGDENHPVNDDDEVGMDKILV
jgi:hypothetical protein